jgi:Myosin N-terminal SH3-like domain
MDYIILCIFKFGSPYVVCSVTRLNASPGHSKERGSDSATLGVVFLPTMPAPRPSESAETARAAALQAEFNEKKWVWVPDDKEGYLGGWVTNEHGDMGEVVIAAGGEVRCSMGIQLGSDCKY